ncbi:MULTISPECIES: HlyD family secretion protein [Burkholderia]|uniref:HlyD family efflux transporter periplasmic adaptor subunit n=3 Tax=Burkholderia contaminans TaxID=488447 RepID=A0A1R1VZX5_9BURK|nr:HlyD family efflux transporter periplasmic adaptor subunit [Burkholderia contaminans]UTP26658.1 HlyD family efflux transporter periplasmic adaptor subunit [Burkholderia sp. FXe9]KKL42431.1 MFP transporter [Burkholderia contaminans LMG 23361]MBA9831774.1 HlyD family efflux transporter periplasmic adaptor subunit [Burkholderia contaminans]MBA9842441.1 HlyD family efflux transporter periplasmic adaptor subunit [Burkholderia contaminans]MBA9864938.1 HlyD family efflux transporter periplasmic ad
MIQTPLFRQAAQDAQGTRLLGEIVLIRPLSLALLTAVAICMAAVVILFFAFGSYTRRTTVEGVITPNTGLAKIYAPQPGVVQRKYIVEGQGVTRGQVLYTVSTDLQSAVAGDTQAALIDQARQRKISLQQEIVKTRQLQGDERNTLQARITSLRVQLAGIDAQFEAQRTRTSLAADAAARYEGLLAKDYISKDQAQQREADLLDQRAKLDGLQRDRASTAQLLKEASNDLSGLALRQQNQLSQIDRSVIDVDQSLIESEAKRELVITAPETGTATAVIAEPGQMVDTTHPLASIVPSDAHWQAYLFVPSAAVGFIHVGDPVLIRYQAFPYQKFGQYEASVVSIARTALSSAELATSGGPIDRDGSYYRITVALNAQQVTAYGKPQPLQAGMALKADVLQERRRLYEWVLEPLYSLTGKL